MAKLGELGLELWFDVYFTGSQDAEPPAAPDRGDV